ncbi:MAG TPA: response regulator [Flavisolibacter sp.]|nr:response regulator [Flavisolibacter sp.]
MPATRYIMYVDDDIDDLFVFNQALHITDPSLHVLEARDGYQALKMLEEAKTDRNYPFLIVLDLNMPGMNGKETLTIIKKNPEWCTIPVVIFSTSSSKIDQDFCMQYNVAFITKPLHFSELVTTISKLIRLCETAA